MQKLVNVDLGKTITSSPIYSDGLELRDGEKRQINMNTILLK